MLTQELEKQIEALQPESVYLSKEQVDMILAEAGWILVPVHTTDKLVIARGKTSDMTSAVKWQPWDIEEYFSNEYYPQNNSGLFRKGSELAILPISNTPEDWERVSMADSANVMAELGYALYWTLRQEKGEYRPYRTEANLVLPTRHFSFMQNDEWWNNVFFHEEGLRISWGWKVESESVTFTPQILNRGNNSGIASVNQALIDSVGLKPVTRKLEQTIVEMPIPEWLTAWDYYIGAETLTLPEAQARAMDFVKKLIEMGLLQNAILGEDYALLLGVLKAYDHLQTSFDNRAGMTLAQKEFVARLLD